MINRHLNRFFFRLGQFLKERSFPFILENSRLLLQAIFTLLSLGIGIWFIRHEQTELTDVRQALSVADWHFVVLGIILTCIYILLQGLMYVASFRSIRHRIGLADAVVLFLKRNLISIFLPAGGISSLAFFTGDIEKKGITKSHIHFASTVYGFVGILSVVAVAIPVFVYSLFVGALQWGEWIALLGVVLFSTAFFLVYRAILKKGRFYKWLINSFSSIEILSLEIRKRRIVQKQFLLTIFYSILIEIVGIAHLYVAMVALHVPQSLLVASLGYIVSVIFLIISPFLRGFGTIELSMTFLLVRFGHASTVAVTITLLYRFFEFWLPLVAGVVSFLLKINKLLMRIVPALLLFVLGIINIVSVLTPAIAERIQWLRDFLPLDAILVSNYFVLVLGLFLLVTASFMLKGLKIAWWFAFVLTFVSMIGNLTKAADFEESLVALLILVVLVFTKRDYYVKNNPRLRVVGIQTALLSMFAVMIYSVAGFYFLDKKHFNLDFNVWQSIQYTFENYFLIGSDDLIPADPFAAHFIHSINISGFLTFSVLIYTLIRPYFNRDILAAHEFDRPKQLLDQYGNSSLDYFKVYPDKMIFEPEGLNAFISYRPAGNFAVVLENPVAQNREQMRHCIRQFDRYCFDIGLKSFYYRVPESDLQLYRGLKKRAMFIGQEGIVDLSSFSLEGGSRKSIRNALSKVRERGFKSTIHHPPIKDGLLQKLKSVSDEWLELTDREEIIFSQGMFSWEELKGHTIITVENSEEKVIAFLNLIPDYTPGEGTYDLLRKTADAPNGIMDFLLVEMFFYLKAQGFTHANLGFAPMSGLDDPHTFREKSMKFAYEKIRGFAQYKGLREYKEKFVTKWVNKYLIYEHDFDLLQIPGALSRVIKP